MRLRLTWPVTLAFLTTFIIPSPAADWAHWRGPTRNDLTNEPSGWNGTTWLPAKPAWQVKLGEGSSSPLVVGDRLYFVGYEGQKDALRCLNTRDGKQLWSVEYKCPKHPRFHEGDEGLYSGPSATPEFDAATGFLYTLSSDGHLNCWNTLEKGKQIWGLNLYDEYKVEKRPRLTRSPRRDYGYTSSPMVHGDWLLVEVGSTTRGTLIAFDKRTGKEAWASEFRDEAGHTGGPAPMTIEGVPCVALLTQRNLAVIRLDTGKEGKTVATFPWVTDFANSIAGPAVHGDSVLITSAYNQNAIVKLKIALGVAKEIWRKRYPSKVCTPVIHDGHVYVAWQKIRCLNWETGDQKWEGGSVGDPGSCIVTADGRLIVYGQNGKLILVEGAARSPDAYKELAVKDRIFDAEAWPHVVLSGGRLYCRDRDGNLACFDLGR